VHPRCGIILCGLGDGHWSALQLGGGEEGAWRDGGACGDKGASRAVDEPMGEEAVSFRKHRAKGDDGHVARGEGIGNDHRVGAAVGQRSECCLDCRWASGADHVQRERADILCCDLAVGLLGNPGGEVRGRVSKGAVTCELGLGARCEPPRAVSGADIVRVEGGVALALEEEGGEEDGGSVPPEATREGVRLARVVSAQRRVATRHHTECLVVEPDTRGSRA
jgi:hypothetical protein